MSALIATSAKRLAMEAKTLAIEAKRLAMEAKTLAIEAKTLAIEAKTLAGGRNRSIDERYARRSQRIQPAHARDARQHALDVR
jgi:hypothetical protein